MGDSRIADIPGHAVSFSVSFAVSVTDRMRKIRSRIVPDGSGKGSYWRR